VAQEQRRHHNPTFRKLGIFTVERLVNMSHHNYRLEPDVRFSLDSRLVFFTSNIVRTQLRVCR
jgi:oligogalacturonide lyase